MRVNNPESASRFGEPPVAIDLFPASEHGQPFGMACSARDQTTRPVVCNRAGDPAFHPVPFARNHTGGERNLVRDVDSVVLCALWVLGSATLLFSRWQRWRGLRAALRTASPLDLPIGMKALISPAFSEPGVFGVRQPVLLLPVGITDRLTPPQLKAIVAHELCHVRRRDNLLGFTWASRPCSGFIPWCGGWERD
jgi:hypothetical protein